MQIRSIIFLFVILLNANSLISVNNNRLFDEDGGQRIFHGLNLVVKQFPYYHLNFNETDLLKLKNWGMNGIRLGVMWPGVQPKQGYFNQTYLQVMKQVVNLAAKYNVYTLVQFHQDLFSQKFCGDGVPLWAIPKQVYQSFPKPVTKTPFQFDNITGLPRWQDCGSKSWGQFYLSYSVNKGFHNLWKNKNDLLYKFAKYWKKVAQTFRDNKFVIGYQLINEPWPGNVYKDIFNFVPGTSEHNMKKAYDYLSRMIRSVDPLHNICYQPVTWGNNFPTGFNHPPGGFSYKNSSILCYHFYRPPVLVKNRQFMKAKIKDIYRLKSAGILSEFYVIDEAKKNDIDQIMDLCDQYGQSWLGWIYNPSTPSNLQKQLMTKSLTRTYAQRIAGPQHKQKFDKQSKIFTLQYIHFGSRGQSVIYFSKQYHYPNGIKFNCSSQSIRSVNCSIEQDIYLKVRLNQQNVKVKVIIQRA